VRKNAYLQGKKKLDDRGRKKKLDKSVEEKKLMNRRKKIA
jgi:hypothetical protein